jgi:sugar phosphate isomerase/epimerase
VAFTLSALTDEVAPDLATALQTLRELDIHEVELRTVYDKNVLDLTDAEARRAYEEIAGAGFRVSGIASPIGKSPIDRPAAYEEGRLARALELAEILHTRRVRVFSFYPPEGSSEPPEAYLPEATRRLAAMARSAEAAGVLLVLENEYRLVGDVPGRIRAILEAVGSPALRFAWDPGNFVHSGVAHPFADAWPLLGGYVACCHVKDYRRTGEHVPAGDGDGEWPELVAALAAQGGVPLVMEPHMTIARHSSGYTGPERFREAVAGIRRLLPPAA